MINFLDTQTLDIDSAFKQLGIADYTYIQTTNFLEQLEVYRSNLLQRIGELQRAGNGESVGESTELCQVE